MMHDILSEDLTEYYRLNDKKEKRRFDKRKKSLKDRKNKDNPLTDKERWLNGDGPQTD